MAQTEAGAMTNAYRSEAAMLGCDATHRAGNLNTHLTHGCIQYFRHFSRVRRGCAHLAERESLAIPAFVEGAVRTLGEVAA